MESKLYSEPIINGVIVVVGCHHVAADLSIEFCCSEKSRFSPKTVRAVVVANQREGLANSKPKRNLTVRQPQLHLQKHILYDPLPPPLSFFLAIVPS
jgi:hypothetical protein